MIFQKYRRRGSSFTRLFLTAAMLLQMLCVPVPTAQAAETDEPEIPGGETTLHSALWRSEGTTDQLYLALRLAVSQELTPAAPFILDDALVRFDDARLSQALSILDETARDHQVILFTCQNREKRLLGK